MEPSVIPYVNFIGIHSTFLQNYSGQENSQGQVNASCGQHPWPLFLPVIRWHPRGVNGEV
ncbi:hypothetical protein [Echinicola sp. 20G]|uniref:hypothetical protein n=1 Tax=Echinicola sp. 20G TaxID=2781961 RepID=UPI00191088AA|nr:hypothetical protein [Echinicola sp. 20G]